jgi:hypothetical protein
MNASGNTKMANAWYPAIRTVLGLGPPIDTTPPTVTSTSPGGGATGVDTAGNVMATFSELVDPTTLTTATFELRNAAGALTAAAASYSAATSIATLDPSGVLTPGATYTAKLKGGTTDPRVKDLAGNALAADRVWTFTTASAAPPGNTSGGYTTSALANHSSVIAGQSVQIQVFVTSAAASTALVDVEIYSTSGTKLYQQWWDNQTFIAGQQRTYTANWIVPATTAAGTANIRIGVFKPGWGTVYHWNASAGPITITR